MDVGHRAAFRHTVLPKMVVICASTDGHVNLCACFFLCVFLSIELFCLCVCMSCLPNQKSKNTLVFLDPSIHPTIHVGVCLSIHLGVGLPVYLPTNLAGYPSILRSRSIYFRRWLNCLDGYLFAMTKVVPLPWPLHTYRTN